MAKAQVRKVDEARNVAAWRVTRALLCFTFGPGQETDPHFVQQVHQGVFAYMLASEADLRTAAEVVESVNQEIGYGVSTADDNEFAVSEKGDSARD